MYICIYTNIYAPSTNKGPASTRSLALPRSPFESVPLWAVHLSRHKWPVRLVN